MKKLFTILITCSLATGCVSKRETISTTSPGVEYTTDAETSATVLGSRLWITFIPIGLGPRKYEARKEKAIQRFKKHHNCDAIADGQLVDRRVIVPLIVINYSVKWAKIKGKPAHIKK